MEPKCPFTSTFSQPTFRCEYADEVIRRGGSEYDCRSPEQHPVCMALHERLKEAALPVFDVEDDLLSMPHSVLVKIQFGGLLGLQRLLDQTRDGEPGVNNVVDLVNQAIDHFGGLDAVPCDQVTGDMTDYKVARRKRR